MPINPKSEQAMSIIQKTYSGSEKKAKEVLQAMVNFGKLKTAEDKKTKK